MLSQGEEYRGNVGGGWYQTRQRLDKSLTLKIYTTWAHILSDIMYFTPRGEGGGNGGV